MDRMITRAKRRRIADAVKGCFAQHDYNIANAAGATVRSDINDVLAAAVTWNSGASAPGTTFARMRYADTTLGVVRRRNAANSGWLVESTDDETRVLTRSSNTMLDVSDIGKVFKITSGITQTFDAVASLTDGWYCDYIVDSGVTVVFDPASSENIDGATTKTVIGPCSGRIFCNASALFTSGFFGGGNSAVNGTLKCLTTIGVGAATPAASGAGITFPAVQSASSDANTLDDYEEGTWTPVETSSSGTITTYNSAGTYKKVGRLLGITGQAQVTNAGTASGYALFSGYPFTCQPSLGGNGQLPLLTRETVSSGACYQQVIVQGGTNSTLQDLAGAAPPWTNNLSFEWTGCYPVSA